MIQTAQLFQENQCICIGRMRIGLSGGNLCIFLHYMKINGKFIRLVYSDSVLQYTPSSHGYIVLVRDKICKQYQAVLYLELPYCQIFLCYTLHSYSRKTIAFVLGECTLACLEEIYAFPFSFFSIHFYMFTDASKREGRVKRDLMLCISCPVYIRLPRYPSTKSQLFSKLFSDQTKQKRNIYRLTIDIQNLSIF